jgi:hypothetical protein
MPVAYKVLGQSAPSATTDTTVYTVPASTEVVISTVVVANRGATDTTFRLAVRPDAATLANQHYLAYDTPIPANGVVALTLGITMDAADLLVVYAGNANLSFNVFGQEIS